MSPAALLTPYGVVGVHHPAVFVDDAGLQPYTDELEKFTIRRTAARRAASNTCTVPMALAKKVASGMATDTSGWEIAAVWMTQSMPCSASTRVSRATS